MREIQKIIDDYLEYLGTCDYSSNQLYGKKYFIKRIMKFLSLQKIDQFSSVTIDKLDTFFNSIDKKSMRQNIRYEMGNLFIYLVEKDIVTCNPLGKLKRTIKLKTDKMKTILNDYIKYVKEKGYLKTINNKISRIKNFLCFLEKYNMEDFNKINMNSIGDFLSSIDHILYRKQHLQELRMLFSYLIETHIVKKNPFGNLRIDIDFNKLPHDLQYYFTEYMQIKLKRRSSVKLVLRIFFQYLTEKKIISLDNLGMEQIKDFFDYFKKLKNRHGKKYKKSTLKDFLYLLRKWFLWLVEKKEMFHLNSCCIELNKIIDCFKKKIVNEKLILTEKQVDLLANFIENQKLSGVRTYKAIKCRIHRFYRYVVQYDIDFIQLKHREAQNYQTYLATLTDNNGNIHYDPATILRFIFVVKNFYTFLKKRHLLNTNPFNGIKLMKCDKKLPRNLPSEKELNEFLCYLGEFWKQKSLKKQRTFYKLHVISELMYASGLRLAEVSNLLEDDIDFDKNLIMVCDGKGGKQRIAYLSEYASQVLKIYVNQMRNCVNHKKRRKKIFGTKNYNSFRASLNTNLKKYARDMSIENFTSHCFRHCLGYHLLKNGCDIRYIQLILGHNDLGSTEIYTKVDKEQLKNQLDNYHPRQFYIKEEESDDK